MNILLTYICVTHGPITYDYAARFVATYLLYPPGIEHKTVIACNGGMPSNDLACLFAPMDVTFYPRYNDKGWDISAYQDVAAHIPCDMMVCCGESVYFHKSGWMMRLALAWKQYGPGFYGFYSSHLVRAHLNTTAFACDPKEIRNYQRVKDHKDRYNFEHGESALWRKMHQFGKPTKLVTWDGVYDPGSWRKPPNILWRGDQTNTLAFCNHTDRFNDASPEVKQKWSSGADRAFR